MEGQVEDVENILSTISNTFPANNKAILPPIVNEKSLECLPQNLLATLTQQRNKCEDLGPAARWKLHKRRVCARADNVWNHQQTRNKFKHLMEQPACYCGAGRDISFLLDAEAKKNHKPETKIEDILASMDEPISINEVIPEEFNVIKQKGVKSIQIQQDKFTTHPNEHENHQAVLPSLKPAGRQEAIQLLKTMDRLLKKAGVNNDTKPIESSADAANQIEELLGLVQEEQKIYNIVFGEIIRQVSVECVQRGEVLAELRKRYAAMLDKIPKQVKSLHNEVLAQRALDRRLTEELTSFRSSISALTRELYEVHTHDEEATHQAMQTQAELNDALKESEKNASLLVEYHDLYELQRRRLDYQMAQLMKERDMWAGGAHLLSMKVTQQHSLVTARRLHLYEKAWHEMARKFANLLSNHDEKQINSLVDNVNQWLELSRSFNEKLSQVEDKSCTKMKEIAVSMKEWSSKFSRVVSPDEGCVSPLDCELIGQLRTTLKEWEAELSKEVERFSGDVMLSFEDDLLKMSTLVDLWTEIANRLFKNHTNGDGSPHLQQTVMLDMNKTMQDLHDNFKQRMCGQNGVNREINIVANNIDKWVNKFTVLLSGEDEIFESEWIQLNDLLHLQWPESLRKLIYLLSRGNEDGEVSRSALTSPRSATWVRSQATFVELDGVTVEVQSWLTHTVNSIDNENNTIIEQVSTTHSNMVRWVVTILLRLTPDYESSTEDVVYDTIDPSLGIGSSIAQECESSVIIDRATSIFGWIRSLTDVVVTSCNYIVEVVKKKRNQQDEMDLKRIEIECRSWIYTASLLVKKVTDHDVSIDQYMPGHILASNNQTIEQRVQSDEQVIDVSTKYKTSSPEDDIEVCKENVKEGENKDDRKIHVIADDENVAKKSTSNFSQEVYDKPLENQEMSYLSMSLNELSTLQQLQDQLIETEGRVHKAEDRAMTAEGALKSAHEQIRALERKLQTLSSAPNSDDQEEDE